MFLQPLFLVFRKLYKVGKKWQLFYDLLEIEFKKKKILEVEFLEIELVEIEINKKLEIELWEVSFLGIEGFFVLNLETESSENYFLEMFFVSAGTPRPERKWE